MAALALGGGIDPLHDAVGGVLEIRGGLLGLVAQPLDLALDRGLDHAAMLQDAIDHRFHLGLLGGEGVGNVPRGIFRGVLDRLGLIGGDLDQQVLLLGDGLAEIAEVEALLRQAHVDRHGLRLGRPGGAFPAPRSGP